MCKKLFLLGLLVTLTVAVSAMEGSPQIIDKNGNDVLILGAGYSQKVLGPVSTQRHHNTLAEEDIQIDLEKCQELDNPPPMRMKNCTQALEDVLINDLQMPLSRPLLRPLVVNLYMDPHGRWADFLNCHLLEIDGLLLKDAYDSPNFEGVGFFSARNTHLDFYGPGSDHITTLIPKDNLHLIHRYRSREGKEWLSFKAVYLGKCWQGSMTSSYDQSDDFKAFVQYQDTFNTNEHMKIWRVWENEMNHHLGAYYINDHGEVRRVEKFARKLEQVLSDD